MGGTENLQIFQTRFATPTPGFEVVCVEIPEAYGAITAWVLASSLSLIPSGDPIRRSELPLFVLGREPFQSRLHRCEQVFVSKLNGDTLVGRMRHCSRVVPDRCISIRDLRVKLLNGLSENIFVVFQRI
jgi:hypothetical protein